ncbi:MAG: hypothetical protein LUG93_09915, partial [Lachnospiraceae bacterium]|nr:hypothetical protein [Lachnospiraceae bacterium]
MFSSKKTSRGRRFLAIALAMAMILQQAGITTLADDGTTLAAETAVTESVTEAAVAAISETEEQSATEETTELTTITETQAETTAQTSAVSETTASTEATTETTVETTEATDTEAQTSSEAETEASSEDIGLTGETAVDPEEMTEALTEMQTEALTEEETGVLAETQTEALTEEETEALTEEETKALAEAQTEALTEEETEALTEAETEETTEEDSNVGIMAAGIMMVNESESDETETALSLVSNATINVELLTVNGETYNASTEYDRDSTFKFQLAYSELSEALVSAAGGVVYYTLPDGLLILGDTTGTIYDDDGYACGTFAIVGSTVYFYFDSDWLAQYEGSEIHGTFTFSASLSDSSTQNTDSTTIKFEGSSDITINFDDGTVTGSKKATINSDGTVTFTITFTVEDEDAAVTLTDVLGSNLYFTSGTTFVLDSTTDITSYFTISGSTASDSTTTSSSVGTTTTGNTATATLPSTLMTIGTHTITYTVLVYDTASLDATGNTVNWSWYTDGEGEPDGNGSTTSTVTFQKSSVSKSHSYTLDSEGNLIITWTIVVTPDSFSSVLGSVVTDTAGDNQHFYGTLTVKRGWYPIVDTVNIAASNLVTTDASGNEVLTYTFPSTGFTSETTEDGKNYAGDTEIGQEYRITYQTIIYAADLPAAGESMTISNSVDVDGNEDAGDSFTYTSPESEKPKMVSKSGEEKTSASTPTITWTITVDPTGWTNVKNLTVKDTLYDGGGNNPSYVAGTLKVTTASGETLTEGTDYTITWYDSNNDEVTDVTTAAYYVITFSIEITEKIYITYDVTYNSTNKTITGQNLVHATYTYGDDDTAGEEDTSGYKQITQDIANEVNVDKTGNLTSGNTASWSIVINSKDGTYADGALSKRIYTVTDQLPEGTTLDTTSVEQAVYNYSTATYVASGSSNITYSYNYDQDSNTITFTYNITNASDNDLWLILTASYSTTITSTNVSSVSGSTATYTNNATVKAGDDIVGADSATVEVNTNLTKAAAEVSGSDGLNQIAYTIGVNYGGEDLSSGSDTLTLTDILDESVTLVMSSVSVKRMYADENGSYDVDYTISYETLVDGSGQLTLVVPDGVALWVTYNVKVSGTTGSTITVSNTATLTGVTNASQKVEISIEIQDASATAGALKDGTLKIVKVDSTDINTKVEGATFELYQVNITDGSVTKTGDSAATDSDGTITFTGLQKNTLYYYVETDAATGYINLTSLATLLVPQFISTNI